MIDTKLHTLFLTFAHSQTISIIFDTGWYFTIVWIFARAQKVNSHGVFVVDFRHKYFTLCADPTSKSAQSVLTEKQKDQSYPDAYTFFLARCVQIDFRGKFRFESVDRKVLLLTRCFSSPLNIPYIYAHHHAYT